MEIRAFAQQVLLSSDLDAKLWSPEALTDLDPGRPLDTPRAPGRPGFLPLVSATPAPPPPTPATLADPRARGEALHTFAQHELMALELMALALLRFPDAPSAFRRGLAAILMDEQRHFRLYQARAEHHGVALGEVGATHFFWDTVHRLDTPEAFLAALSLTYEQANLDFTAYWVRAFEEVDDRDTAAVLRSVHADEIRHVAHGVHWFARLAGAADFATWAAHLTFPLSPGRAKGPILDRAARLEAGLDAAFIDELAVSNVSRGRPPRVFSFDPFVEEDVAGRTPGSAVRQLATDLGSLPMFLAHDEDVVWGPRPAVPVLAALRDAGFAIPQFVDDLDAIGDRAIAAHCPWGWSPAVARARGRRWNPDHAVLYDKAWAFAHRTALADDEPLAAPPAGAVCRDLDAVRRTLDAGDWIAKAPLSASGQHRLRLSGALDTEAEGWLRRHLRHGPVVVEPWYDRVADLSVQLEVGETSRVVGLTRFATAANGAYRGAFIGTWTRGLGPEVARFAHGGVRRGAVTTLLERAGLRVAHAAAAVGYRGPLGVDAMIVRIGSELAVVPVLEVNPRYTMGRIALALRERCTGSGVWLFLPRRVIEARHGSVAAFANAVAGLPRVRDTGIRQGAVLTTDPHAARRVLTVLVVGPDAQAVDHQLRALRLDAFSADTP